MSATSPAWITNGGSVVDGAVVVEVTEGAVVVDVEVDVVVVAPVVLVVTGIVELGDGGKDVLVVDSDVGGGVDPADPGTDNMTTETIDPTPTITADTRGLTRRCSLTDRDPFPDPAPP
ncbi:MAG: hypothetical protein ABW219_00645, partial [Ilumatobacteraceae bacterium]